MQPFLENSNLNYIESKILLYMHHQSAPTNIKSSGVVIIVNRDTNLV